MAPEILSVLSVIKDKIFNGHEVKDASSDFRKMYLNYMCSEQADCSAERQSATVTFLAIIKLLSCLEEPQDPGAEVYGKFTIK
jgi:hypothetical protein